MNDILSELHFTLSNFDFEDEDDKKDCLERSTTTLLGLDTYEQKIFMRLLSSFTLIPSSKYYYYLKKIFTNKSLLELIEKYEDVIIYPILKPQDLGQEKSSSMISNPLRLLLKKLYPKKNIETVSVNQHSIENVKEGYLAIFVDDFIGSGKSAYDCFKMFKNQKFGTVSFISLAILNQGLRKLNSITSSIYFEFEELKCFDVIYKDEPTFKSDFKKMCDKLKISESYLFGFGDGQALLRLINTPNNTLGLYWMNNQKLKPVFPRII